MFRTVDGQRLNIVSFGSGGAPVVVIGGQSPTHIERLTPEGMVDDVFGVLDVLSIDRCVLIGESQGGFIPAMAVLRDSSRFVVLGIVDSTPVHQPSPASDAFAALLDEDPDSPLLPFVERCIPEPGCEHIRRCIESAA